MKTAVNKNAPHHAEAFEFNINRLLSVEEQGKGGRSRRHNRDGCQNEQNQLCTQFHEVVLCQNELNGVKLLHPHYTLKNLKQQSFLYYSLDERFKLSLN
jgi:hypothetical protein